MKSNSNIKDKKNTFVIKIHKCDSLSEAQTDFLSKLLFLSKYKNSFEINRSLVEICTNTKLKKNFDDGPRELLIYYNIPASEPQLQTFESDFVNIISSKQDKRYYEQLDHDDIRFSIVGVRSIANLSVPQVTYMNNLINNYKKNNLIAKTNSKPCNHHHNFSKRISET
jgi:hypothetical protein